MPAFNAVVIPHRIMTLYNQRGECTRIICTNALHRGDDKKDVDRQHTRSGR